MRRMSTPENQYGEPRLVGVVEGDLTLLLFQSLSDGLRHLGGVAVLLGVVKNECFNHSNRTIICFLTILLFCIHERARTLVSVFAVSAFVWVIGRDRVS